MIQRLLDLRYILLFFIVIQIAVITALVINEDVEKKIFLDNKTKLSKVEFDTIYAKTEEQSQMIFQEHINIEKIKNLFQEASLAKEKDQKRIRHQLHTMLLPSYTRFKDLINLKQVHFHFPDNHSFLRMHKIEKFGDDLSLVRPTVVYVNKYKKAIDGFEEGRVYNGFRFVYPLFDNTNNYIGSVEVSFSALSFQKVIHNDVRFSQFLFSKDIIDEKVWKSENKLHYIPAEINPNFLIDINSLEDRFKDIKIQIMKNMSLELKKKFAKNLSSKHAHSLSVEVDNSTIILSFLPIKNPINDNLVAYLVILSKTAYLDRLHFKNTLLKYVSFAFLLSLFAILYGQRKHEDEIQEQNLLLLEQSKMAQMGSMLSNIAHQWKQPLARINSKLIEIPLSLNLNDTDTIKLENKLENIENLTLYMANTIESFRNYFHPDKELNEFSINAAIDKAISLLDINTDTVDVILDYNDDIKTIGYKDELIQVLMILIINAYEALENTNKTNSYIKIRHRENLSNVEITVTDNAGGIEKDISGQIFNPYFSTKDNNNNNNGIGLYMAKMIIEVSMKGKLAYKRRGEKSHFCINLPGFDDV